jgi:phage protein U
MQNFNPEQFLQQYYAPSAEDTVLPGALLGGGVGAGLSALFAKLSGNSLGLPMGIGAGAGALLGLFTNMDINSRKAASDRELALASLSPQQYDAVMKAYGEQMHVPMNQSVLF